MSDARSASDSGKRQAVSFKLQEKTPRRKWRGVFVCGAQVAVSMCRQMVCQAAGHGLLSGLLHFGQDTQTAYRESYA
ncbi:MAG TPA: hypothetical protein DEP56_05895 [Pseudomonas sp.]|nr:hypothetical protein [Pseudomonas sp.]